MTLFEDKQSDSGEGTTSVPPPPPEVSVRTMASDLEYMRQSGGETPKYQSVPLPVSPGRVSGKGSAWAWWFVGAVALVGLFLLGYFVVFPLFD